MPINITLPYVLAALSTGNQPVSKIDDDFNAIVSAVSGIAPTTAEMTAAIAAYILPRSYLAGYGTANNVSDATNDIDISVGSCVDSTNAKNLVLASALTKRSDAAWAVGTNQGGLDIGSVSNRTYHIHSILRSDTGVVDALFSCNAGASSTVTMTIASPCVVTWTNHGLQAGSSVVFSTTGALPTGLTAGTRYYVISAGLTASAFEVAATDGGAAINTSGSQSGTHTATSNPVLPTSYDYFRRIASPFRVGGAFIAYTQMGDYFRRSASILDVDATNPGTSAVTRTLSVPVGVNVFAILNMLAINAAADGVNVVGYLSDLAATDELPSSTTAPLGQTATFTQANNQWSAWGGELVRTNKAAQIRSRVGGASTNTILRVATLGWWDPRGRDD